MTKDKQKDNAKSKIPVLGGQQRPITDHLERIEAGKQAKKDPAISPPKNGNPRGPPTPVGTTSDSPAEPDATNQNTLEAGKLEAPPPPRIIPLDPPGNNTFPQDDQPPLDEHEISNKAIMEQLNHMNARLISLDLLDSLAKDTAEIKKDFQATKSQVNTVNSVLSGVKSKVEEHEKELADLPVQVNREIDFRLRGFHSDVDYEFMIRDAQKRELNLIVDGISEDPPHAQAPSTENVVKKVRTFCQNILGHSNIDVDTAHRLGVYRKGASLPRPILFRLMRMGERKALWRARSILQHPDNKKFRLREDMPDRLREDQSILLRVLYFAKKAPEKFWAPKVIDFKFHLEGRIFRADELEDLPFSIRPSTLATPRKGDTIIFFAKFSPLSNHYPSRFWNGSISYDSMEHYLPFSRAEIERREDLMTKAIQADSAVACKRLLNSMRSMPEEKKWEKERGKILYTGLYEKFTQNSTLKAFLLDTGECRLGEACKDQTWGIGMSLEDPEAFDHLSWGGNLQGKTLMRVRRALRGQDNRQ